MAIWHLLILIGIVVFGILFAVLKVLSHRADRHHQYVDQKEVMDYYRKKIDTIRAKKAKQKEKNSDPN